MKLTWQQKRAIVIGTVIGGSFLVFLIFVSTHSSDFPSGTYVVKADTIGSESLDNLAVASNALNHQDTEGVKAMVLDGRVFIVPKGTEINGGEVTSGVFLGTLQSGRLIGKEVYIGVRALAKK